MRETYGRVPGSRRIPLHDHSDLNSGGKLRISAALQGGLGAIIGSVPPSTGAAAENFVLVSEGGRDLVFAHDDLGSTEDIDPTNGNVHSGTLNDDCTITLLAPNPARATSVTTLEVYLLEDGTGGWAPTFDADGGSIVWPDGSAPDHDTTADSLTRYVFETLDDGVIWYGNQVGSGATALTIEDEGTPLATAADTLNFVGDGVVASGTGAEKTVTISGAPTGAAGGDLSGTYPNPSVVDDSHSHTATTLPGMAAHAHVVSEAHLSNGSGTTYTLDQAFELGSVIAWNTTSLARLGVTETEPDQATVSAAGSSGDTILFDYAATVV